MSPAEKPRTYTQEELQGANSLLEELGLPQANDWNYLWMNGDDHRVQPISMLIGALAVGEWDGELDLRFSDQKRTKLSLRSYDGVVSRVSGDLSDILHELPLNGVFCDLTVSGEDQRLRKAIKASGLEYAAQFFDGENLYLGYRAIKPVSPEDPHCQ